ncbi:MAG: hypothetical protein ACP5JN_02170 [Candidatus Micrarchaeia archaeon]
MFFLLQINTCAFAGGGVNADNWISINMIVVLTFFAIAGLIYAFSNLLPASTREKLKTTAKFEVVQIITSLIIIIVLVGIAELSCNFTNSVAGMDPFGAAQIYLGRLLFSNGISLATHIYTTSIEFMIASELSKFLSQSYSIDIIESPILTIGASIAPSIQDVYTTYEGIIVSYNTFVIITFGMLFLQFLLLFIVKAIMLTVVLPVAIAMRSLAFLGHRVREAADSFLALAIAFYFVYPLTFVMDSYIMNWTYCTGVSPCNPYYSDYPVEYTAGTIPGSLLFQTNPNLTMFGYQFVLPANFYGSMLSAGIPFQQVLYAPVAVGTIAQEVSDFVFQGIVLMALNLGITAAFAQSLQKALSAGLGLRSESIWS